METKPSKAFSVWRRRMDFTYREAAHALGICPATIRNYCAGRRKERKEDDDREVEIPKYILLACAAVEKELPPIS